MTWEEEMQLSAVVYEFFSNDTESVKYTRRIWHARSLNLVTYYIIGGGEDWITNFVKYDIEEEEMLRGQTLRSIILERRNARSRRFMKYIQCYVYKRGGQRLCEVPGTRRLPHQDTHPARTSYGNTALSHVIGSVRVHRLICDFGLASCPARKPTVC